mmetsp:Transcript_3106/g.3248  ORF Transcript_3106/g.3248 Transcript_3106/m.3248 type:complete len:228 (-) Transcript_3106:48-731(-)|eukprot:CAMPEP_0119043964 /NCGR_PEP_ID=MMETSP1177-20130426/27436_1 /TAXON_ID=2985 /ORGANISM="Ochromonas sp, Strain CCMP1899" /LENGTH=227 /DNA_ID=CAMNT_0007013195 /DNA_START=205 /DNA_END=888 /DNA_ORIENTATION=+
MAQDVVVEEKTKRSKQFLPLIGGNFLQKDVSKSRVNESRSKLTVVKVPVIKDVLPKEQDKMKSPHDRAQIYALNKVLKKAEIENFEKLKADVASGKETFEPEGWCSDDSSVMPSPFDEEKKGKTQIKERSHSQQNKTTSNIEILEKANRLRYLQLTRKNDAEKIERYVGNAATNNPQFEKVDIKEKTAISKRKKNSKSLSTTAELPSVFIKQKRSSERSSENRFGGV